jgi:hypothetical protein
VPTKLVQSPLCPSEKITEEQRVTDLAVLELDKSIQSLNRRSFFTSLTAMGAAAAAVGLLSSTPSARAQTTPAAAAATVLDVLNFALNLEYLEANLYISVSGSAPLPTGDGAGAKITGLPGKLNLDAQTLATAQNLAADEMHHIELLRAIIFELGGTPVSQPVIDYSLGGKMSITTQAQFLAVARQFTAVGNSAYAGGAQYLVSNPFILTGAGQILGAEAQHLGGLNVLCALQGVLSPTLDTLDYPPVPPNTFFTLTPTNTTIAPTAGPALGPIRTTAQVLGIVYGVTTATTTTPPTGITSGGFFPQGVNGVIHST